MSLRVMFDGLPEEWEWLPEQLGAVFGRENHMQGVCIKQLAIINDLLRPSGLVLHRMDMRYYRPQMKEKIKKFNAEDQFALEEMKKFFILPRAALQGMCLASRQDLGILDDEPVDERLGPHARLKDGGALQTHGSALGSFPRFETVLDSDHPHMVRKPFRRLHTNSSADGIPTNEFLSIFAGRAIFYFKLGKKPPFKGFFQGFWGQQGNEEEPIPHGYAKIDINTSEDMGWRLIWRGDQCHGFEPREGCKFFWQVIGPEKWDSTFAEDDPWLGNMTPQMPEEFLMPQPKDENEEEAVEN